MLRRNPYPALGSIKPKNILQRTSWWLKFYRSSLTYMLQPFVHRRYAARGKNWSVIRGGNISNLKIRRWRPASWSAVTETSAILMLDMWMPPHSLSPWWRLLCHSSWVFISSSYARADTFTQLFIVLSLQNSQNKTLYLQNFSFLNLIIISHDYNLYNDLNVQIPFVERNRLRSVSCLCDRWSKNVTITRG